MLNSTDSDTSPESEEPPSKVLVPPTAVTTRATPPARPDAAPDSRYFNPELAWLEFDLRVLEEAEEPEQPLLERVKFLAIFNSNLDEFFMIRVAGLHEQIRAGMTASTRDRLLPTEQLAAVRAGVRRLVARQHRLWTEELMPLLAANGICLQNYDQLDDRQRAAARAFFDRDAFPVLTPLAVDPGHPFPHISNLSLNLAVVVDDPVRGRLFARIKLPASLPRLVPLPSPDGAEPGRVYFVWLEQVVAAHLDALFPGLIVRDWFVFRVTRDADVDILEDEAADLLRSVVKSLRERHFGSAVRLELQGKVPEDLKALLVRHLRLSPEDIFEGDGPLAARDLMSLYGLDRPDLKDQPLQAVVPRLFDADIFETIRRGDVLLHHPYDSFAPVVQLIEAAAVDPKVLAIKQTLYRIGSNSPLVPALIRARENGKQVAVLVELKARFDEENNIEWARELEQAGVHVVYGLLGLKTHCKVALIVRRELDGIRRYVHLSTGNYNPSTARIYTDLGLLTCRPDFGADASELFNYLTGFSRQDHYRKLLVAPVNLRRELEWRIRREIAQAERGEPARLLFKMNTLQDYPMTDLLYQAATAGVRVDLIVRGICIARPGLPELDGRLQVISVVGRFLEHSRAYYFLNGGDEELYLGSADLMPRNLDRRVETLFPIEDPELRRFIKDDLLEQYLRDTIGARRLRDDGRYERVTPLPGTEPFGIQEWLVERARQIAASPPDVAVVPRAGAPLVSPAPD
jgi:polyphosphate kinase